MIECCPKGKRTIGTRPRRQTWTGTLQKAATPSEPAHEWLLEIADQQQPSVRQAFLDALARVKDATQQQALDDAIARQDVGAAMRALGLGGEQQTGTALPAALDQAIVPGLQRATLLAGIATGPKTLIGAAARMRFDITNPKTAEFIHNYNFGMIRQISDDTREGIRQVIENAFAFGGHPYEQARTIRESIGLTQTQAGAVANFERMLRAGDRTALTRNLRDARHDRTLNRILGSDQNLSDAQISTMVGRYRTRMIQMRAQTIARTETIRASNAAQNLAWEQAADKGLLDRTTVRRFWLVTPDDRLCPYCEAVPGLNEDGVALGDYFDTPLGPVLFGPLHPNCRCITFIGGHNHGTVGGFLDVD